MQNDGGLFLCVHDADCSARISWNTASPGHDFDSADPALHQTQDDDIRPLFKTVMELPISRFTGKRMAFTALPSQSVGEVAHHIIHSRFLENFNLEETCCAIRAAGSAFANQTVEVTSEQPPVSRSAHNRRYTEP